MQQLKNHEILQRLESEPHTVSQLADILKTNKPHVLHAVVLNIKNQILNGISKKLVKELLDLLPKKIDALLQESQLELALLYRYIDSPVLPEWKILSNNNKVYNAWIQTALVCGELSYLDNVDSIDFYHALETLSWTEIKQPEVVWNYLRQSKDIEIIHILIRSSSQIILSGAINHKSVYDFLVSNLETDDPQKIELVINQLSKPWGLDCSLPIEKLTKMVTGSADIAIGAINLLCSHQQFDGLWKFIETSEIAKVQCLLKWSGEYASYSHMSDLIYIAKSNTSAYGSQLIECLFKMTRRGIRIANKHIDDLFSISRSLEITEAYRLKSIVQQRSKTWIACLQKLNFQDSSWPLQIKMLGLMAPHSKNYLVSLLENEAAESWQRKIIKAVGKAEIADAQNNLLKKLDEYPENVLEALNAIISDKIIRKLLQGLENSGWSKKTKSLVQSFLLVMGVDPYDIYNHIETRDISSNNIAHILITSTPPSQSFDLLVDIIEQPQHSARLNAIERLRLWPHSKTIDVLAPLLADPEKEVREKSLATINYIVSQLFINHYRNPVALTKSLYEHETQEMVVANCILDKLPNVSENHQQLLIEQLALLKIDSPLKLVPWIQHKSENIQKWVLTAIQNNPEPELISVIYPFLKTDNIYLLRPAINAIAAMGIQELDSEIAVLLDHPNMNIKKTAAHALTKIATKRVIQPILNWLQHHDNPGLRETLIMGLKRITGDEYPQAIWAALETCSTQRHRRLLLLVLKGSIDVRSLLQWINRRPELSYELCQFIRDEGLDSQYNLKAFSQYLGVAIEAPHETKLTVSSIKFRTPINTLSYLLDAASNKIEWQLSWENLLDQLKLNLNIKLLLRARLSDFCMLLTHQDHRIRDLFKRLLLELKSSLLTTELILVNSFIRDALKQNNIPLDEGMALLHISHAELSEEEAVLAIKLENQVLRRWALNFLLPSKLNKEDLLRFAQSNDSILVQFGLKGLLYHREYNTLFDLVVVSPENIIQQLKQCWDREPEFTIEYLLSYLNKTSDLSIQLEFNRWLSQYRADNVAFYFLSHLSHKNFMVRDLSEDYIRKNPSQEQKQHLLTLLESDSLEVRKSAARLLLIQSNSDIRNRIITNYLDGQLGEMHGLQIYESDLAQLQKLGLGNSKYYIKLLVQSKLPTEILMRQLLDIWHNGSEDIQEQVAKELKGLPVNTVFGTLLADGQITTETIDIIGIPTTIPNELVYQLQETSTHYRSILYLLQKWSEKGVLLDHPDIYRYLMDLHTAQPEPLTLKLLGCVVQWKNIRLAKELFNYLRKWCSHKKLAKQANESIFKGISYLPLHDQVPFLLDLDSERALDRLTDIILESPDILDSLPTQVKNEVDKRIRELCKHGNPLIARSALWIVVQTDNEHKEQILFDSLSHSKRNIRIYAHRLIKRNFSKDIYLEATTLLLKDSDPDVIRTAIRIVTFNVYEPAIKQVVNHLFSKKSKVKKTAQDCLANLDDRLIPVVKSVISHLRPDHRRELKDLIDNENEPGLFKS